MSILVAFIRCTRVAWQITTPAHFSTDENGGGHSNQNLRTFSDETPVILERLSIACYSMVSYLSQHWLIDNGLTRNWRQVILWANANPVLRSIFAYISQKELTHYDDVIMGVMASQITSLTILYSTVYSGADQRKHYKVPRRWPLCAEFTGDRWIPRTNGQ